MGDGWSISKEWITEKKVYIGGGGKDTRLWGRLCTGVKRNTTCKEEMKGFQRECV